MRDVLEECPCRDNDDLGRFSGVRDPLKDVRDIGRGGGTMSVRDEGRAYDDILARELGLLLSASGARFGNGPKDRRLTPDVLSLGTWPGLDVVDDRKFVGVVSSPACDDAVEPAVRLRERIVTVDGTPVTSLAADLGDARGGVFVGPGSFDRTDCTRASKRCIFSVRDRI